MSPMPSTMRAVRFERWGDPSVLEVMNVPVPTVDAGRVLVKVEAAGINPGEAGIRSGAFDRWNPTKLPSGQGTDLAGVVVKTGSAVTGVVVGDEVLGWSWERASHAEYCSVPVGQIVRKPKGLSWEVAGALDVAGTTAFVAVRAVEPTEGETAVVSAAAGGVGGIVAQLLRLRGVRVIGIASPANFEWLQSHGVEPVAYGEGLLERVRLLAPDGVNMFIDTFGEQYVHLAIALGVRRERINTIIAFAAAAQLGVKAEGSSLGADPAILAELAHLAGTRALEIPIAAIYRMEDVQAAYVELERRHTRGKIVLVP